MKTSKKTVWLTCNHCGHDEPREIDIGTSLNGDECPNCGEVVDETDVHDLQEVCDKQDDDDPSTWVSKDEEEYI